MVSLQILLLCVSVNRQEKFANRTLQSYGAQMCKALCDRLKCSDSIFDEVMLICKLQFTTQLKGESSCEFENPETSQLGTNDFGHEDQITTNIVEILLKPKTTSTFITVVKHRKQTHQRKSGFFVKTDRFGDSLEHETVVRLKGLPRSQMIDVFFNYEEPLMFAYTKATLYVGAFKHFTVNFRKDCFIREMLNKAVQNIAIDRKNNILATRYGTNLHVRVISLKGSLPTIVVVKLCYTVTLYIDKNKRLIFYQKTNERISSFNYRGQYSKKYKAMKIADLIKIEVEDHTINCYTCTRDKVYSYKYDTSSKKPRRKKFNMNQPCGEIITFLTVGDTLVIGKNYRGMVVERGRSSHTLLKREQVQDMFSLQ